MRTLLTIREYRMLRFVAIGQVLKKYDTLKFYHDSQWELTMRKILKTDDHRAKRKKIWASWPFELHM